jgi:hypothetical protein
VQLLVDPSQTTGARVIEGLLAQYSMQEISKEAFTGASGRKAIDEFLADLDRREQTTTSAELKTPRCDRSPLLMAPAACG